MIYGRDYDKPTHPVTELTFRVTNPTADQRESLVKRLGSSVMWREGCSYHTQACPNCGSVTGFAACSGDFTETHGLDCGPYEMWHEEWLECHKCKGKTDDSELQEVPIQEWEATLDAEYGETFFDWARDYDLEYWSVA